MEKLPQISEAEYELMKIIWKDSPISTNDICQKVPKEHRWSQKTVHTLLSRLTAKHVVDYEKRGRMYYYYPIISQKHYLKQENHQFLERFYNGKIAPMLSTLLSDTQISQDDLKKMYQMLDEKLNGGDKI